MEITHYMFAGVGVAVSILAFFIKRIKVEIDEMKERVRQMEINDAGQKKDVEHLTKLAEDRREDVRNIFKKLDAK
jgi:FtsZ-binding cell division protein ZapB|tara:strand:- start:188 stop:412 length:225 start_codon:yes stop_codon:yes gene_type:complete